MIQKNKTINSSKYFLSVIFFLVLAVTIVSAQYNTVNYTAPSGVTPNSPSFVTNVLKYDPYPVNAGDSFDVWIEVQNIGTADARNVKFQLSNDYPFSTSDNIREFGDVYGTSSSYQINMQGDANTIVLKYRVKVADDAPAGTSNLNLMTTINDKDSSSPTITQSLPIVIGKTKTDFDVVMQDSSTQGTSFAIANVGENPATAVSINLKPASGLRITGSDASIIGNLAQGDFTTVTFQIAPNNNLHNVTMEISYTDTSGVRNTVDKIVNVNVSPGLGQTASSRASSAASTTRYIYLIIGIVLGVLGFIVYKQYKQTRQKKK